MPHYVRQGLLPHKRHTQFRDDSGSLRCEEMFTTHGFAGSYSLLYHLGPPTELISVEPAFEAPLQHWEPGARRPHLLRSGNISAAGDCIESRRTLMFNEDVTIAVARPNRSCEAFYRNALSDELVCVAAGSGELATPFGTLAYGAGDMIVIPRGTVQLWRLDTGAPQRHLVIEAHAPVELPRKYLNGSGQFNFRSPLAERDVRPPVLQPPHHALGAFEIRVKRGPVFERHIVRRHPFDVVGWDGLLYPYAIDMADFEPITRRIHTMPDENMVFETRGAVICCLVPRPMDYHPDAIPAPPYHMSVDVDEVIFNMGDRFMGWKLPDTGAMTLHPRGFPHGPKHGLYEASIGMKTFDGHAIMIDTARPLALTEEARSCDEPDYPRAWLPPGTPGSWED